MPDNTLGHQGLFVDRLDGNSVSMSLLPDTREIYHNRNRTYHPGLGRFLQKDPNATGMVLLTAQLASGTNSPPQLTQMDLESLYENGINLCQYQSSHPNNGRDPLGLSLKPFGTFVKNTFLPSKVDMIAMAGYFLGIVTAGESGFGPSSMVGAARMTLARFGWWPNGINDLERVMHF